MQGSLSCGALPQGSGAPEPRGVQVRLLQRDRCQPWSSRVRTGQGDLGMDAGHGARASEGRPVGGILPGLGGLLGSLQEEGAVGVHSVIAP